MQLEIAKATPRPPATVAVAASKMFTFPTRLADAWNAESLEINLPGYILHKQQLEIAVRAGSTHCQQTGPWRLRRMLARQLASAIEVPSRYVFDARWDTDSNTAHVLLNVAPAVLHAKESFPELSVILRARAAPLAKEAYGLLGVPVICTDGPVSGRIITGQCGQGAYEPWYRSQFGDLELQWLHNTPERVFISRKWTRRLANEEEVERTLRKNGFQKFYFEEVPLVEQWSIARNAKVIVSIFGAALATIVFNRTGVKVLEMFHPGFVNNFYRHVTNAVGGTWCGVTGQMPTNIIRELDRKQRSRAFVESPLNIDLHILGRALEQLGVT